MSRDGPPASLAMSVDRHASEPLHRQLYAQMRQIILAGRLAPGSMLPSTRSLMREMGLSRTTVLNAFAQLHAEGYIEGRVGAGTFVAPVLPESLLEAQQPRSAGVVRERVKIARRAIALAGANGPRERAVRPFQPGVPETDLFPFDVWSRLYARFWRNPPRELLSASHPAGYPRLREVIADYLVTVRAVRCRAQDVIVTPGALNGIDMIARTLLNPGDRVWVEEPGYDNARAPLRAAGAELVPVPVDGDGLRVDDGRRLAPDAKLAVVTPSRQFPLGVTMGLSRRLELLEWARDSGAWILEDDYDSEYRYAGHPVSALQGLDGAESVIYMGTFSKVLFPALRIAYLVAPEPLSGALIGMRAALDDQPSIAIQPQLTEFMESGQFSAHVRRMRSLYAARQARLLDALVRHLAGVLEAQPQSAGMHVIARLCGTGADRTSDVEASRRAAAHGITAPALSRYYLGPAHSEGLLLGYAGLDETEIEQGAERLARALR